MEKRSFVKGAAILAIAGLIVKFIGAVYRIPLNNIVGTEGMAYYSLVYDYYAWLLAISSAGLPTAISKMVSERVTLADYRGARSVFKTAFKLLTGIGIVTTLIMFLGAELLSKATYPADATAEIAKQAMCFRALAPSLLFVSIMCAYRGYLQGLQRMSGTAASQVVEAVGKLAVGFGLAMALLPRGPEYAAMGALIGISASELLALVVIFLFYRKNRGSLEQRMLRSMREREPETFGTITKKLLRIAIPVTIGASVMPMTNIVDSLLVIRALTGLGFSVDLARETFSILKSYVNPIINMPAVLTTALAMSLVPAISSRMAQKDYKGVRSASRTGMKLALIIGAPCCIGLFVLAKPILGMLFSSLVDAQLDLAAELMQTACIGVVFLSLVQTLSGVLQGLGKPNVPVVNLFFGGILKVVTMVILMKDPRINIQGAAVSTVVCYASAGLLNVIYLVRKTSLKLNIWDVFLKPLVSAALMGVAVHFSYTFFISALSSATLATIGGIGVGVIVYGVLVFVLKMFSPSDLAFIPGGGRLERLMYRNKQN